MKIYDCFTFWVEFDLLELRLELLDPYVDKFILVESRETFSGHPKPLYYEENKERFAKWNDKIIHIIAGNLETTNPFERHYLCYELIEGTLLELGQPDDIAFCSDLDEIWNPEILKKIDDKPHSLNQLNYCYYLNMRSSEDWVGTLMTKIKNMFIGFNKLNRTAKPNILPNGGWHWTNQGGAEQVVKKVAAYDHAPEINYNWVKEHIEENIEKTLDYLGRDRDFYGRPFLFWLEEDHLPKYLIENKEKYKHLWK